MLNKSCMVRCFLLLLISHGSIAQPHHHIMPQPQYTRESVSQAPIKIHHPSTLPKTQKVHNVHLTVDYKWVEFGGVRRKALTINQQIPAPILHFKEGDRINLHVHNLLNEGTSLHWHGLLVPWQMDGVEGVSQTPIPPGGEYVYRFTLRQSGTYWYHAHQDVQEQEGLYGAIIVDPIKPASYRYNKDAVIVLSDWSNTPAEQIYHNLKMDGDYYSVRFPLQASLFRFLHDYTHASTQERKALWTDYANMQQMRMGIYDLSDVAYDAFLLNGHTNTHPWEYRVKQGDIVRLRFIGAASSTIYKVKMPGTQMQMVHVQGNDVAPQRINDFTLAPGETLDVLVTIKRDQPYPIYAESIDKVGAALGLLKTKSHQKVPLQSISPFPEPEPVTRQMMQNMMAPTHSQQTQHSMAMGMNMGEHDMSHMKMPTEPSIVGDTITHNIELAATHGTKYQNLSAAVPTNDPHKPIYGTIKMELFGYMGRYLWMINGLPEYKTKPILMEPNRRYRFIFTNNSMMRHPMHLHGHWFILRNGNNSYDPLLHTIEVPPGATAMADVDTDASGQWFFHCHHLYHMRAGMARIFQYQTIIELAKGLISPQHEIIHGHYINRPIVRVDEAVPLDKSLIIHPMAHPPGIYFANYLEVGADPFHNVQELTFKGLYGNDYHKLELQVNDAEVNKKTVENADIDVFYWHPISQFWALKGGANYMYRPAVSPYWQPGIGLEGLMPYFIEVDARAYFPTHTAKFDLELSRDTQISNNFFIQTGIRGIWGSVDNVQQQIGHGLNQMRYTFKPFYRLFPGLALFTEFEYEQNYGNFKRMQQILGESAKQTTLSFGLSTIM